MIICRKKHDKVQYPLMIKTQQTMIRGNFNFVKDIYKNPTVNSILTSEKSGYFPVRLGKKR